jgi:hypothetical protein
MNFGQNHFQAYLPMSLASYLILSVLTYFIFILHQNPIDETFYKDTGLPVVAEQLRLRPNRQALVQFKSF